MNDGRLYKNLAHFNAIESIWYDRAFPLNVFREPWDQFAFFESDVIFNLEFILKVKLLLDIDNSNILCLINLGSNVINKNDNINEIYLDRTTEPSQYIEKLIGDRSPSAWLYRVDKYVCAPDSGNWCIYCEKENDIAVIALKYSNNIRDIFDIIDLLSATLTNHSRNDRKIGVFNFEKLVPPWRDTLIEQYSTAGTVERVKPA